VNGQELKGPGVILRNGLVAETSFVVAGQDRHTPAVAASEGETVEIKLSETSNQKGDTNMDEIAKLKADLDAAKADLAKLEAEKSAVSEKAKVSEAKLEEREKEIMGLKAETLENTTKSWCEKFVADRGLDEKDTEDLTAFALKFAKSEFAEGETPFAALKAAMERFVPDKLERGTSDAPTYSEKKETEGATLAAEKKEYEEWAAKFKADNPEHPEDQIPTLEEWKAL
jgi:hypothetical protein